MLNSNKVIEIFSKKNAKNKLTITPSRVTIKLQDGASEVEASLIIKSFIMISEKPEMKNCKISFRGSYELNSKCPVIQLFNDRKTEHYTYQLGEL